MNSLIVKIINNSYINKLNIIHNNTEIQSNILKNIYDDTLHKYSYDLPGPILEKYSNILKLDDSYWRKVSYTELISTEFIDQHIDQFINDKNFLDIGNSKNCTLDLIEKHIDKPWHWSLISKNQNVTEDFIEKYIDKSWSWLNLSFNNNITFEFIEKYSDKPWNVNHVYINNNIIIDIISKDTTIKLRRSKLDLNLKRLRLPVKINDNCNLKKAIITNIKNNVSNFNYYSKLISVQCVELSENNWNINIILSPITDIIEQNIDKNWDWNNLSYKEFLTCDFIEKYINKPWNWGKLSEHKNITTEFIIKYHYKEWSWVYISLYKILDLNLLRKDGNILHNSHDGILSWKNFSRNPSITLEFIDNNSDLLFDWKILSSNNIITSDFIDKYIDKDWDWNILSYTLQLSIYFIDKYIDKWNWNTMSQNKSLTLDIIEEYIDKPWAWPHLSLSNLISPEFVLKYKNKPWSTSSLSINLNVNSDRFEDIMDILDCEFLSYNSSVTSDFIEKYIDKNWRWRHLSSKSNITLEFIDKYHYKDWDWDHLSCNEKLTCEFIEKYLHKEWNWSILSKHVNITIEFINKHKNMPWDWGIISANINITFYDYMNYQELPWTYRIFHNKYILDINTIQEINKYIAKLKIKRIVRAATCNPIYKLARKKILEEYENILN